MPTADDLKTTVKNISGNTRFFGYLGRLGVELAHNATYTFYGSIDQLFRGDPRKYDALYADLTSVPPNLQVLGSPKTVVNDTTPDAPLASPAAPTVTASGGGSTGGALTAGIYYVAYSWVTATPPGETLVGPTTPVTVLAGNIPRVAIPALATGPPAATSAKVYVSAVNGSPTALKLYKSGAAGASNVDLASANWNNATQPFASAPSPPPVNSTGGAPAVVLKSDDAVITARAPSWV